jgi:hypothetical protein
MAEGVGGSVDSVGAFVLSGQLCVNGLPADICGYRGLMRHDGIGTLRDQAAGLEMMRAACSAGDQPSCADVARLTASPARK